MGNQALLYDAELDRAAEMADTLRKAGVSVTVTADFETAVEMVREHGYDLVVASQGSDSNPFQLVLATRRDGDCSPAIILTLPREAASGVLGILPMAAIGSRGRAGNSRLLRRAGLALDRITHEVEYRGTPVTLTPHEYRILECLLASEGVVSRQAIGLAAWGTLPGHSNALDVHLGNLRRKLRAVAGEDLVRTRRGHGYVIEQQQTRGAGCGQRPGEELSHAHPRH